MRLRRRATMSLRHTAKSQFYFWQRRFARRRAKRAQDAPSDRLMVFILHTINPARSDMAVSPARFREQMQALLDAGYRALPVDDMLQVLSGAKSSQPAFALTFDDGYESVFTEALPILESLSIPASVFLTTGFLDGAVAPPWRSASPALLSEYRTQAEHFRPMRWEQARSLAAHPLIRVGSHTVSHPLLGAEPDDSARDELVRSKSILADRLGVSPDLFSYPFGVRRYGAYSDATERLLRETGYRCSFTSEISRARVGAGPWRIPRMSLTEEDAGIDAVAKAAGGYDWVGTAQSLYQSISPNPHKSSSL
jgi:peptidoglycan/xylan/chitin deacetylase (PgdA/CDA1 family)